METQEYPREGKHICIDYKNSLVSLIASIEARFGLCPAHKTLPVLDGYLARKYRNVVLLLFDGMGTNILEKHLPPGSFLRKHLVKTISSVFPPTTTAATTTLISGKSPIEHGWLGWSLWFEKIGKTVNLYPNTSHGSQAADFHVADRFLPYETVFERLERAGIPAYFVSPFSEPRAKSFDELFVKVKELSKVAAPKYIYGYSPLPDYDMHDLGTSHPAIRRHIEDIDSGVEKLAAELSDSIIIVTADHGMTDTDFVFMDDYPEVKDCLLREPSVEGRAMSLFTKPGMKNEFAARFNRAYEDIYDLVPHEEAMRLFGDGNPHPLCESFIGDFLATAKGRTSLGFDYDPDPLRAAHGGGTREEAEIPLIIIRK